MDFTARMLRLLDAVRRERNGEVADTMRYYGAAYGLNYGVSLPTLRSIARTEGTDHLFARYLYQQDIRELRLASFWIADPERLTISEASFWAAGILNSEMAEEFALALLGKTPSIGALFTLWTLDDHSVLIGYAALLGVARNPLAGVEILDMIGSIVDRHPDDRLTAQGIVALIASFDQKRENRAALLSALDSLGNSSSARFIREEIAWRLEV